MRAVEKLNLLTLISAKMAEIAENEPSAYGGGPYKVILLVKEIIKEVIAEYQEEKKKEKEKQDGQPTSTDG